MSNQEQSASQNHSLHPVPFHGATIFAVEHNGEPYSPVRPIVENMGLGWANQFKKINNNRERWTVVEITTVAGDGKNREMLCMPVRKLAGFLSTISVRKVRADLREKILSYQKECDEALWQYWHHGRAENPRADFTFLPDPETPKELPGIKFKAAIQESVDQNRMEGAQAAFAVLGKLQKQDHGIEFIDRLVKYRALGLSQPECGKLLDVSVNTVARYEKMLRECGISLRTASDRKKFQQVLRIGGGS